MKRKITQRVLSVLILMMFGISNTALSVLAVDRPQIRMMGPDAVKLNATASITEENVPITLSLRDSDVKQVLRMFADRAGMNIIFDSSVSGTVTMDLVEMPLNAAFELVLNITKLNYVVQDNTLIVSGSDAELPSSKQEITMLPVKYIDASSMAEFLNKNIFAMKKPGLSSKEIVSVNPMTNELLIFGTQNDVAIAQKILEKFDKKPVSKNFKISHTTPEQMADMICKMLIPATSGGGSTGGAASISGVMTGAASSSSSSRSSSRSSSGGGNSSEVELGGGEVSCTVKSSSSGSVSPMPFESLIISYFTQQGTIGVIGGSEYQLEMIEEFIKDNDRKQPQAYLELSIIELSESGSKELQNTWQYMSKNFNFNAQGGSTGTHSVFPIFFKGDSFPHYGSNPKGPDDSDYTISKYTGRSSLTYTINYLIENNKGRVVANPRILITNGQQSTIDLTSDYVKTVTSQVVESSLTGAVQRTYEIGDDNGIKITVTPFISPDGYVTLNINPDYATIAGQVTTASESGTGEDIQATLLQRRNLELKNVRIKDGETLVIGGLIRDTETKTVKKIPFLGDIPGLGMFFRSTSTSKSKEEMLIMITPRIIVDSDDSTTDTL